MMASREASVFGCLREAVNVLVNWALSSLQECMDPGGKLLYQSIAVFLRVVGNNLHLIGPPTLRYWSIASKPSMWSIGSSTPSYVASGGGFSIPRGIGAFMMLSDKGPRGHLRRFGGVSASE